MKLPSGKKLLILVALVILLVALPVIIYVLQQNQNTKSRADIQTTLKFTPDSTAQNPIKKEPDQDFTLDMMVNPGTNKVSFIKYEIIYDATKISLSASNPITYNTNAFPVNLEGPVITPGRIAGSISVGNNPSSAIITTTRIATISFKALTAESEVTYVTYTTNSQALSVGENEQASENVLESTTPAAILITNPTPTATNTPIPTKTPTPTLTKTPTPIPSNTPTSTPKPTNTPFPTSTPVPQATKINLNLFLHGLGNAGDNANPSLHSLSNKNPGRPQRTVTVSLLNSSNIEVANKSGVVTYNPQTGTFKGVVDMGNQITTNSYNIKITTNQFLTRRLPGIQSLTAGITNTVPDGTLVNGDANNDNKLDILDYNIILGCYSDFEPAKSCTADQKLQSDFTDDSKVNQFDYNLFLRELSVQGGD